MTSIERTAYPRFTRTPSVKELREIYTPTPTDVAFVSTHARGPAQKLALMVLLKVHQRLHYFPDPQTIPRAVIDHLRAVMKYPSDLVPDIAPATLYRYYASIRGYLEIKYEGKHLRRVTLEAMYKAALVMENPSDLINAAVDTLLAEPAELPAFGTLDRMAGRVRRFVNGGMYQRVAASLTAGEQHTLLSLLEQDGVSPFTLFDRIKDAPKSATITHLDDWLSRLIWLQSLGIWSSTRVACARQKSSTWRRKRGVCIPPIFWILRRPGGSPFWSVCCITRRFSREMRLFRCFSGA